MKLRYNPPLLAWFTAISLLASLCFVAFPVSSAQASSSRSSNNTRKISSDLNQRMRDAQVAGDALRVILQFSGQPSGRLNALLNRNNVHVRAHYENFNASAVELPASVVQELASFSEVSYVSLDREVDSLGHVETTTGALATRTQQSNLDGRGVTIAVLDSSIYNGHVMFAGTRKAGRIVANVDFVCPTCRTPDFKDMYGHGTHVAGLLAGNDSVLSGAYQGIAPRANLVNLRVLDDRGTGKVSTVLSALNWIMTNRLLYNIRVVNMSIGTPAIDSFKDDPLCKAVRRLTDAGVVVVAAAGNDGKNASGQKIYGAIHSPGNEPSAITVGATNTYGTDTRADDTIATYSSRGPTRSSQTDSNGTKRYDNLIKPDLVAPGNKIVSSARTSFDPFSVNRAYPEGNNVDDSRKMLYLSGTSMATPLVSGAVALLLQANPSLTPNMVKMLLMYTAQPLSGFNTLEQGAGQLNIEGAVRLASYVRTDLTFLTPLGAPLLTIDTSTMDQAAWDYNQRTTIAGHSFPWARGIILDYGYATGTDLITKYQKVYGKGILLGDGIMFGDGILLGDGIMFGDGSMYTDGIMFGDQILNSDGQPLGSGTFVMGAGIMFGDGILLGDGIMFGDGILLGDGIMFGDSTGVDGTNVQATSVLVYGDDTTCMR